MNRFCQRIIRFLSLAMFLICFLSVHAAQAQEDPLPNSSFPTFDAEMFLDRKWHDERLAFEATAVGADRIESFSWNERFVEFVPLPEKMGSEADQAGSEWAITHVSTEIHQEPELRSEPNFSAFIFNVHVERLPGYYLCRIMPVFILIALSWSTFWMEGEPMPGRMGRSFIALLTVVAFHRIISDMMPRISYMTFLDGMVAIAYLFTSVSIFKNVIVNHHRVQNKNDLAHRIDLAARWLVPLSFLLLSGLMGLLFLL